MGGILSSFNLWKTGESESYIKHKPPKKVETHKYDITNFDIRSVSPMNSLSSNEYISFSEIKLNNPVEVVEQQPIG